MSAPAATLYFIHADHLETPRLLADQTGKTVWRWENGEAFGDNPPEEDPDGDGQRIEFNHRFPGQYYDRESGLHYNFFREYDPGTGRYTTSDPIGLGGGVNTYGYVGGNPISYTDSMGLAVPNPNDIIPGGPWTPNPRNNPGNFSGPKQPTGGRAQCQWVPSESNGGPPGSNGYWKTNEAGQKGCKEDP